MKRSLLTAGMLSVGGLAFLLFIGYPFLLDVGGPVAVTEAAEEEAFEAPATLAEARPHGERMDRIRAVTLDARNRPGDELFDELNAHHITHISVIPFGYQASHDDPQVQMRPHADWSTESDHGITELSERARAAGIGIILKPHIWLRRGHGGMGSEGQVIKWRDEIGFVSEDDWTTWERSYTAFMLHYARLATAIDADMLCIGTELSTVARVRPAFWRGLIRQVREIYSGPLTYAANWYQEYAEITFWDALDYIGVQAYFPLADTPNPSVDELVEGWKRHMKAIDDLRRECDRPVLFTEVGYRSVPFAARKPWQWPARADQDTVEADNALQARLYEAFFRTFWEEPWVGGAVFWKWYPPSRASGSRRALDFTPQDKPAARVLAAWYAR